MFFFFFFEDDSQIVKQCLRHYIEDNIKSKSYCNFAELFSDTITKKDMTQRVEKYSPEARQLYKRKYPDKKEDLLILSEVFDNNRIYNFDEREAFAILFWCFKVFKKNKSFETHKQEIISDLMKFIYEEMNDSNLESYDSIIFDKTKVLCYQIQAVSDYLLLLNRFGNKENLFFRGHSKTNYSLRPSVMRNENIKKNESKIYQELIINCPDDFKGFHRHIDYLVKMQHYGLPTRLLDITRNPLVALYFACCSNEKEVGEIIVFAPEKEQIKYENSDTVAMLASLPLFTYEEQAVLMDYLYVPGKLEKEFANLPERFVHEVQTEKPGFIDRIRRNDMENCFIVLPKKDNSRIVKQDGAFIICGINETPETIINQKLRLVQDEKQVLVFVNNKDSILNELDLLSINKSTLFPEIDYVADYIRSKYEIN